MVSSVLDLQVSYCLLAFVCVSLLRLIALRIARWRSRIELPLHANGNDDALLKSAEEDPFDILKTVDAVDGESPPAAVESFQASVRRSKIGILVCLVLLVGCSTAALVQAVSFTEPRLEQDIVTLSLQLLEALYLLVLASHIRGAASPLHSEIVTHIAGISGLASLILLGVMVLPSSVPPASPALTASKTGWITWELAVLLLHVCISTMASNCPLKPLAFSSTVELYTEKEVSREGAAQVQEVCQSTSASIWGRIYFAYTDKVVAVGADASSDVEVSNFPIVPVTRRATYLYSGLRKVLQSAQTTQGQWGTRRTTSTQLLWKLIQFNGDSLLKLLVAGTLASISFYIPYLCLEQFVSYLESDPNREDRSWGWFYVAALFISGVLNAMMTGVAFSMVNLNIELPVRLQISTALYQKTLVRKDAVAAPASSENEQDPKAKRESDNETSSKAQIMNLMTIDVERIAELFRNVYPLIAIPIEMTFGTWLLYRMLGPSCFFGLGVIVLLLPVNHLCAALLITIQEGLMKARDERVSMMNELLGNIRTLKFMAWERRFQSSVDKIRITELNRQKRHYRAEVAVATVWHAAPILVTAVSFWHFTAIRGNYLSPAVAFTSIAVFEELKWVMNALPECLISIIKCLISWRRIHTYLQGPEVDVPSTPNAQESTEIGFDSATLTWTSSPRGGESGASTPSSFIIQDATLRFPSKGLSLVCGKLGSGKSLLLLSLLGEAEVLSGNVHFPRASPDTLSKIINISEGEDWITEGAVAYVPQTPWLLNASIENNILFGLPMDNERYHKTLEACALISDLNLMEDGDQSEIGERGINLSGGQKARVSLARAIYSRASIVLLDDVLSAVDSHTAHHIYNTCLTGSLMSNRTTILISHHLQLCVPGAKFVAALDNGKVVFQGSSSEFVSTAVMQSLLQSNNLPASHDDDKAEEDNETDEKTTNGPTATKLKAKRAVGNSRVLVEEEKRAVGTISQDTWLPYFRSYGGPFFWSLFLLSYILASLAMVSSNWWIKLWSGTPSDELRDASFYIGIYAAIGLTWVALQGARWFIVYHGSIRASKLLHNRLLEAILFATTRFHDTSSRGRVLNRFSKDLETLDSTLPDAFANCVSNVFSAGVPFITIIIVAGWPVAILAMIVGYFYFHVIKVFSRIARDLRRLDSVTRSPLYSLYGETIAGVTVLRAFGASTVFLRDMFKAIDTNANPFYWTWAVNRWLNLRCLILSQVVIACIAVVSLLSTSISASTSGFALSFCYSISIHLLFLLKRYVTLEQSMVALERIEEYSTLPREAAEFVEPRPPVDWPQTGRIKCDNLTVRYAQDLPNVLHGLSFDVKPGEKVGVLGRTGSGKSTLALSFLRLVEPYSGTIIVDGVNIRNIGLSDLRSNITIIPQDPAILSGTLRSTLDVFGEHDDAQIYQALRRVHLISEGIVDENEINENIFRNLDTPVSEGGNNFSAGQKQLLCMARAILRKSKVVIMDEATASVDYSTDELISRTIKEEFADRTVLTIAHRLRTVIDYDRVMVLEDGRLAELDKPSTLLQDTTTRFYGLCKATGPKEFAVLKRMARLEESSA